MIHNGDGGCFDDYFRADFPRLVKFLVTAGFAFEAAQDAAEEAMLTVLQEWSTLRSPHAYVRKVALRWAVNQARRDRERVARSVRGGWLPQEETDPVAEVDDRLDGGPRVTALLAGLPARQRVVLAWHLDGFSNSEIAEHFGLKPATVGSNLRHAKQALRAALATTAITAPQPPVATAEGGVRRDVR
ncbi:RNA polymerase sigma factor [Kutzneria kofuensis]|uniref:RNA polymerase sigma-70 factor (ECF subfamily) n=1 Tax=Kutzneria kofuensis TaxID=103725 RepID=A0A7W9KKT7_9PSEU|nr:sigma factor-like helix-turn-helix DNA-binding protein [Kutzneria kofuensis]MBB5894386.1 RNA polymerase sigma-70 factor (ECF subfamily) [Kutzneria kofuensis]